MLFLLHGEDSFRTRLRLAELVHDLLAGGSGTPGDLSKVATPDLGVALGVTRHDARYDKPALIALSGQSQGLFAATEDRSVVVVDNAESLVRDEGHLALIGAFPSETALVLVALEQLDSGRPRRSTARARATAGARAAAQRAAVASLPQAVEEAGGRAERIGRLPPEGLPEWIRARASLRGVDLSPAAVAALASLGPDTERLENEIAKLGTWAAGSRVEGEDVARLVSGAIESNVFALTEAVVKRDPRAALAMLEKLLADGQAVQQVLALLLWQFRVLLFAVALARPNPDPKHPTPTAEQMAKAIRSSPGAILRWRSQARGVNQAAIIRAYESLYATDVAIKSGRVESDVAALTLCLLDLCGVHAASMAELVEAIPARR